MDTLQRATQLLQPFMSEERRDTWLALAFHAQHRAVYDAMPQAGATADFTVRCVRILLDRGCLGPRHALSMLLEVVGNEAGAEQQASFQALIDELDSRCRQDPIRDALSPGPTSREQASNERQAAPRGRGDVATNPADAGNASPETAALPTVAPDAPRVFVSYAWEDDDYRAWVERLATRLTQDGIDVRLDAWHCRSQTIPEFMNSEARLADKVLIVCSPKYRDKVHAMEDGERITGSGWEAMLVGATLFAGQIERAKIVACLARGEWKLAAPDFLLAWISMPRNQTNAARCAGRLSRSEKA